jgi:transposase
MTKPSKKTTRRRFKATEKVKILKRHLVDRQPISAVCDEHEIQPSRFYSWQTYLFQNAALVFDAPRGPKPTAQAEQLEAKVREKDEVIAEYLQIKKKIGRDREHTHLREQTARDRPGHRALAGED